MTARRQLAPMRGEVWACAVPQAGPHPVVVLTVNRIAEPLSAVTVALVTGSAGPNTTHVRIGPEAGVTKYDESYVNCANVHTIDKPRLRRRLGRLAIAEMRSVESRIREILGL
ncbi:type II toxin-antitoxin system PemK/MazF family toxin [Phytohabitans sp. ZYX-F-186]|uniref:Type II toxin-antitoxin system PemK/MazF family toxin n=1 Tax=Phytohabitans maris TaxID=3071409 RepID=A0ABU0ZIB9_9ACTN|nr:type II toxin-antitoxin system PemK/MazF family toxin [Phytohabitans sp. ZYX-F-186]MDQ7906276.1 type II toxin-antitoxin system PemK/MazF family toxin [Phytohabitans sp. ZYX-F-186]